jgi:predicted permease
MMIYRLLLLSFPRAFREAHAAEMARQFHEERRARRGRPVALAWLWTRAIRDALWHGLLARLGVRWALGETPAVDAASRPGLVRRAWRTVGQNAGGDVKLGARRLLKSPGFTFVSVLTLALGIGSATALFSVVDTVLLRPLPWPEAARLVSIFGVRPDRATDPVYSSSWNRGLISRPAWQQLRESAGFDEVGAWRRSRQIFTNPGIEDGVDVWYVSSSFLSLMGAEVSLGRLFGPDEDREYDLAETALLTHETWMRRFGGRSDILGEQIHLAYQAGEDRVATIVGVLRSGTSFTHEAPDFLLPIGQTPPVSRTGNLVVLAMARLAPGLSIQAGLAAAEPIVRGDESPDRRTARLVPVSEDLLGSARRPLWLLFGGAGLLLLVACANVAGLLVTDARTRRHEIAIRTSLGCSRLRVLRQLTIENLLLAILAASAGLALAVWLTPMLVALAPARLPGLTTVAIDLRVAAFAIGVGVMTVLVFGTGPAMTLSATKPTALTADSRFATSRHPAAHRAIVAGELGLALVLLVCASLFGETLLRLTSQPLGFDPRGLAVVSVEAMDLPFEVQVPTVAQYQAMSRAERVAHHDAHFRRLQMTWTHTAELLDRLEALPGVTSTAAQGWNLPFGGTTMSTSPVRAEGTPHDNAQSILFQVVTMGYFKTMGTPVLRGRPFTSADRSDPVPIDAPRGIGSTPVVVSQELERRLLGGDGVGRRLVSDSPGGRTTYDVIGVVSSARHRAFTEDEPLRLYVLDTSILTIHHLLVRTSGDAAAILPAVRQTIRDYDPSMVVTSTTTMEELVGETIAHERFRARLSAAFGGAALLLAAVGIYSLAARRVAERRREIGVRVALGAGPAHVRRLVVRETLLAIVVGLALGLPAALAASQLTSALLFEVSPTSPRVFAAAAFVLTLTAILATVLPAARASRIDPMRVLRE